MSKKLLVFGSTGATGTHLVRLALEAGLQVRAFARSPDKIPEDLRSNDNLEVFEGNLTDLASIDRAVEGVDLIVSTAGNKAAGKEGPLMLNFVQQPASSMREHGVKRFLYQAGALSPAPGSPLPGFVKIVLRPVLGGLMGIGGMLRDNDAVIEFPAAEASDIDWTVTRPGQIKEEPSRGQLNATDKLTGSCSFVDLAAFNLDAVQSDRHIRECPYVDYGARG